VSSDPDRNLYFDGLFVGLYRTTAELREKGRVTNVIPAAVASAEGYNHIGDLSWDAAGGGRVLLPLECFRPGAPGGPNTCRTGAIAVADPRTLAWLYYVKLDPAEIPKAMWAEVSPDGSLVWTSSGNDLLGYRAADVTAANAAPSAPPIRAVRRLPGAVPPSGITGAAFWQGRLFVAGQGTGRFQVWSIDLSTGAPRLEIERRFLGESEGLDFAGVLGGVLHWQIQRITPTPIFGIGPGALLHYLPAGTRRIRLRVSPRSVAANARQRFAFSARSRAGGRNHDVADAVIVFAGRTTRTNRQGRAVLTARLRAGRHVAIASRRGLKQGRIEVLAR
jgi:hypothetical protein